MKTALSLSTQVPHDSPSVLTIGNFDGVHCGHRQVLIRLVNAAKERHAQSVVLTFANHPARVLRPDQPTCTLCTPEHKLRLLEKADVDFVYFLNFTKEFANQSPAEFLENLRITLPFKLLLLGSDATIGNQRTGNQTIVRDLAYEMGFEVEYLDDCLANGERISSSIIRGLISKGDFTAAEKLLGRPYSIYASVTPGAGRGKNLGAQTANIEVEGLCLPPLGVYVVSLIHKEITYRGVANLGKAPTVRKDDVPILEVHLVDTHLKLYGETVEVFLHQYLRPEKRFDNLADLKEQVAQDIAAAKKTKT